MKLEVRNYEVRSSNVLPGLPYVFLLACFGSMILPIVMVPW